MLKTFFCIFKLTRRSKLYASKILGTCHMLELRNIDSYNKSLRSYLSYFLILVIIHFKASWYLRDLSFLLASVRTLSFYQEVIFLFKLHFPSLQECFPYSFSTFLHNLIMILT